MNKRMFYLVATLAVCVVALLGSTGCASVPVGITAFGDLSESITDTYVYNIDGTGRAPGPQARAGIEVDARVWNGLSFATGIEHRSFPKTGKDRGEERVYVGARYHWQVIP